MVPRDPALLFRPPAPGRAGMPQPGPARPYGRPGDALRRPAAPVRPPSGPASGFGAPAPWMAPPPYRPAGLAASPRRGVIIPRPAPPRRHPVLWSCVLIVLIAAAAAAAYYAMTNTHGRAIADDVWKYVVAHWRLLLPIGIVGGLSWGVWGVRKLLSALYRPTVNDFRTTTSVVVPSTARTPTSSSGACAPGSARSPTEIIVVLDVVDDRGAARLRRLDLPAARDPVRAHRQALGARRRHPRRHAARSSCSPTPTPPGARACSPPCRCRSSTPRSAASARRQNVYQRRSQHLAPGRLLAASTLATSTTCRPWVAARRGGVPVRAHRRLPARGRHSRCCPPSSTSSSSADECVAGDDGRLTWLVLAPGYRTVHQASAQADCRCSRDSSARVRQAAGALEPQLLPLLPDRACTGLAVAGAAHHPGHRLPDPAHAADDGGDASSTSTRPWPGRLPVRSPSRSSGASSAGPCAASSHLRATPRRPAPAVDGGGRHRRRAADQGLGRSSP